MKRYNPLSLTKHAARCQHSRANRSRRCASHNSLIPAAEFPSIRRHDAAPPVSTCQPSPRLLAHRVPRSRTTHHVKLSCSQARCLPRCAVHAARVGLQSPPILSFAGRPRCAVSWFRKSPMTRGGRCPDSTSRWIRAADTTIRTLSTRRRCPRTIRRRIGTCTTSTACEAGPSGINGVTAKTWETARGAGTLASTSIRRPRVRSS